MDKPTTKTKIANVILVDDFIDYNFPGMETNTGNGEDLMTLEAEISELQRENARVESQMLKLKSDINAMENHLNQGEKVSTNHFHNNFCS